MIRLSKSVVGIDERDAVALVIDEGFLGMGKEVRLFETELQAYLKTDAEVICVNTGTSALHLALQALDIGVGDEVLVPSVTYVASFQAIAATGAKPVACDVLEDTALIDLIDAETRVTPATKAIMPVHYASNTAGMADVYQFAQRHKIRVVEDAAHSFGCRRDGALVGSVGDLVCFSFDGIKNITSGEGGAVVSSDPHVIARIQDARLLGVGKDTEKRYSNERSWEFDVTDQGWRYHMSNIMAAIGRAQLKKIEQFGSVRQRLAQRYKDQLAEVDEITLLDIDYTDTIPHIFPVRVTGIHRDILFNELNARGIQVGIHYAPNHLLSLFSTGQSLPVAERLGRELMSLPLHPDVSDDDQNRIVSEIKNIVTMT